MSTKQITSQPVVTYPTKRAWNRKNVTRGAAAVVLASALVAGIAVVNSGGSAEPATSPATEAATVEAVPNRAAEATAGAEILRDAVNRGLVPRQALDPAPRSSEAVMADLVNRGLIPAAALEQVPTSDDIMRNLVDRGLIPAEALWPAPKTGDDLLRDLVYRGLIPAEVLND